MTRMLNKVLVANRGEIACRVIRSARALGYRTVAAASEVDADALHVAMADEAVIIGSAPVAQSYLNPARILEAARLTRADAVHPGYGFLSERADFAQACIDAGLVFIGPTPDAIRAMGDKAEAKRRMIAAGVPCVPGYEGHQQDDKTLIREARGIGFPLMVKASAGGGGRGMRLVATIEELPRALQSARSEARGAFGDDTLLLERAIIEPRHVEFQVFGDTHGNILHLGERDCSVQRRHQKVIEEAPSPAVDPELRARMGAAAVQAARSIDYVGAGTVEFLLASDGAFYFLEMNTRLQVEHPVTELVTGLDLVALQLLVAEGRALPFGQDEVRLNGHAIEARLYAENPGKGFLPQTGEVLVWSPAEAPGVRVDHGLKSGFSISPFYDPMIAKVIAYGTDRPDARRRLVHALGETVLLGVSTNKSFLVDALEQSEFVEGKATTAFIARNFTVSALMPPEPDALTLALAAVLLVEVRGGGWRSNRWSANTLTISHADRQTTVNLHRNADGWIVRDGNDDHSISIVSRRDHRVRWRSGAVIRDARFAQSADTLHLEVDGRVITVKDDTYIQPTVDEIGRDDLRAPMNGVVIAVHTKVGDEVKRGALLMVIEAMKMEHQIIADRDGVVEEVLAHDGDQVSAQAVLISLAAKDEH